MRSVYKQRLPSDNKNLDYWWQYYTTQISEWLWLTWVWHGANDQTVEDIEHCEISSSHGGEYDVQSCLLGYTAV
jgi:hypothetical protein